MCFSLELCHYVSTRHHRLLLGDIWAKFAHLHGLYLIRYLKNWILKHQDRSSLIQQITWLRAVIRRVGLVVNETFIQFYVGASSTKKNAPSVECPVGFTGPYETSLWTISEIRPETFGKRRWLELHGLCFYSANFLQNLDQLLITLYHNIDFVAKSEI